MPFPEVVDHSDIQKELLRKLHVNPKKRVDTSTLSETSIAAVREINPWFLRDLISVMDISSVQEVMYLFATASLLKEYDQRYSALLLPVLKGFILLTMFYEPSTRTRGSFEAAFLKLGGKIVSTPDAKMTSSSTKGETINDSSKVLSVYGDVIVQRHPTIGESRKAADAATVPVINAGDGAGEHPTQALLDLFTITEKFGNNLEGKVITFVGDMLNSRTVHSLSLLLRFYPGVKLVFVSPVGLEISQGVKKQLDAFQISYSETSDFTVAVQQSDVLYMTRIQRERFENPREYEQYAHTYRLDESMMRRLPTSAFVLHPLPRLDEISDEVVNDSRALYLGTQVENGLYVRMALLLRTLTMPVERRKDKKWKNHKKS